MEKNTFPKNILFHKNHRPQMDSGEYYLTINGSVSHADITKDNAAGEVTLRFGVFSDRFALNEQEVRSTFPANGKTGNFESVFPHVVLHRNTLPWERHALPGDDDAPWLALLLFDEDQTPEKKVIAVGDLKSPPAGSGYFAPFPHENGQNDDDKLTVIDVPKTVLTKILPSPDSLKLLAHTRQGVDDSGVLEGEENAVVFCNRLPAPGKRSTMHLVSLEGMYDSNGFKYKSGETQYRLVSLKSWEFYTTEHFKITQKTLDAIVSTAPTEEYNKISTLLYHEFAGTEDTFVEQVATAIGIPSIDASYRDLLIQNAVFEKTFEGLLRHINRATQSLRLPVHNDTASENFLSEGLIPLKHDMRSGDQSVSWYRGPFVPHGLTTRDATTFSKVLSARTADELYQYVSEYGMFDVTYASAWELGRLMALANKDFSVHLFQWKRLKAQLEHRERQDVGNKHLPVHPHSDNSTKHGPIWENHLDPFLAKLADLEAIPANYLFPNDQLLPTESIRFFEIDPNWQAALLSGALSIGSIGMTETWKNDIDSLIALDGKHVMGFAIRSDLMEGWPGTIIHGTIEGDSTIYTPFRRKLARDLELFLFTKKMDHITFNQKPEVLHFGLIDDNGTFKKRKRNEKGVEGDFVSGALPWASKANRVMDMHALSTALGTKDSPAHFAMSMVEGVPHITIDLA